MKFTKGTPKPPNSGRKKGSLNKLAASVAICVEECGHNPVRALVEIGRDPDVSDELRCRANSELMKYLYPQRKAVEHTGFGGGAIEIMNVTGTQLLTSRIDELAAQGEEAAGDQQPD